jgi:hypothetical protein
MGGAVPLLPQYAFMAWCSVRGSTGITFMNLFEHLVGLFGLVISKDCTYTGQHNTEKRGHTSMPRMGFEPMIPVFERSKTVLASDRTAIGTGFKIHNYLLK